MGYPNLLKNGFPYIIYSFDSKIPLLNSSKFVL